MNMVMMNRVTSDSIDFIEEDEASLLGPGHLKQLPNHPSSLKRKPIPLATPELCSQCDAVDVYSTAILTSPTYFWTSSEPMTLMKQASVRLATARAHRVFPVPGGPNSSTPLGGSMPRFTNRSG